MKFEILKRSYLKRNIMIGVVVIVIISACILTFTKAKYQTTQSIPLVTGTINYELSDFNLIGVYIKNEKEYELVDKIPETGYLFNEEKSYCKIGNEVKDDITMNYDMNTKKLSIAPMTTKGTKCYLYFDAPTNIPELLETKTISATREDFSIALENDTTGIMYETEDNEGTTYYFAGAPTDNWVQFGKWSEDTPDIYIGSTLDMDSYNPIMEFSTLEECSAVYDNCRVLSRAGKEMYWRIIRVNGNGSLRLIYAGTTPKHLNDDPFIGVSMYNDEEDDNAYVGYMYGTPNSNTYEETHANKNDSTIKEYIDSWYEKNLLSDNDKIDTESGFCADRRISKRETNPQAGVGKNSNQYYTTDIISYRLDVPSLKCANTNDYFTTTTSSAGNKALTYPVGLITAIEAVYAGYATSDKDYSEHYITNSNMYLYGNFPYRTMTPGTFHYTGEASIWHINSRSNGEGYITSGVAKMYETIRPVINLKADITFASGDGTADRPFKID